MKKAMKNNLDERQMQQYLNVSTAAAWTAYGMLCGAVVVQQALGADFKQIAGETVSLLTLCVVMCAGYLKNGIWDKSQSFSMKKNVFISLIAAVAVGGAAGISSYRKYQKAAGSLATFAVIAILIFIFAMGAICLAWILYEKRQKQLEQQDNEE